MYSFILCFILLLYLLVLSLHGLHLCLVYMQLGLNIRSSKHIIVNRIEKVCKTHRKHAMKFRPKTTVVSGWRDQCSTQTNHVLTHFHRISTGKRNATLPFGKVLNTTGSRMHVVSIHSISLDGFQIT